MAEWKALQLAEDKYTDAEVDAIVLTHKNIANAHHTKPTGNGFMAVKTSAQNIPYNTKTVVILNSVAFDTDNDYNSTTGIYTPSVAGYYIVSGHSTISLMDDGKVYIVTINKNGVTAAQDRGATGASGAHAGGGMSCIVYMNGSTDYVSLAFHHNHAGGLDINIAAGYNGFSAWLLLPV